MYGSIDICINCNDDDNDLDNNDDDQSNDDIHNNSYNYYLTSIGCAPRYPNKSICIILRSN